MIASWYEIEKRILGCLLYEGKKSIFTASRILDETDFREPQFSLIYSCLLILRSQRKSLDILSIHSLLLSPNGLADRLKKSKADVDELCVLAGDLAAEYSRRDYSFNLDAACNFLCEDTQRRKTKELLLKCNGELDEGLEVQPVVDETIRNLILLKSKHESKASYVSLADAVDVALREAESEKAGRVVRLSTGFTGLDRILYGLEKGRLYTLAAEEKIGKSIFASQIALHCARKSHPVGIVSMEMRSSEIARRYAGANSGQGIDTQLECLNQFKREYGGLPVYIRDGSASQSRLLLIAQQLYIEKNLELLIVDYLQLIDLAGGKDKLRVDEINNCVQSLKGLALDLEIPVLLISCTLNKQIHNRIDRKPGPADLRDSGRISFDADLLMFLWQPLQQDPDYRELFISKSRYSGLGKIGLEFNPSSLRFSEVECRSIDEVPITDYQPF